MAHRDIVVRPKKWDRSANCFLVVDRRAGSSGLFVSPRHWITVPGEHVTAPREPLSPLSVPEADTSNACLPSVGNRQGRALTDPTTRTDTACWRELGWGRNDGRRDVGPRGGQPDYTYAPTICMIPMTCFYGHADVSIGTEREREPIRVFRGRIRGSRTPPIKCK